MNKTELLLSLLVTSDANLREIYLRSITPEEPSATLISRLIQITLTDPVPAVRREAIRALARFWPAEPVPTMLRELILMAETEEAACVVAALALIEDDAAVPFLEDAYLYRDEFRLKADALAALSPRKSERVRRFLSIVSLRDTDEYLRAMAVRALGQKDDPTVVNDLCRAMADADPRVRANAVESLGRFRESVGHSPFARALEDPSQRVKSAAALVLNRMRLAAGDASDATCAGESAAIMGRVAQMPAMG